MTHAGRIITVSSAPSRAILMTVSVTIVILTLANLVVSNVMTTSGDQLRMLLARKQNLIDQNAYLRKEITGLRALRTIETNALSLGFTSMTETLSITSEHQVAMRGDE